MRLKLLLGTVLACALALFGLWYSQPASSAGGDVILLYGWHGTTSNWDTAKAAYQAQGYTVHVLQLPRNWDNAGDTAVNADFVQQYMTDHGLTSAKIDGHSMGGWLVLYLIRVRQDSRITSAVMRDTGLTSGFTCYFVPDDCAGSAVQNAIASAPADSLPVFLFKNPNTVGADGYVDCVRTANLDHNSFLTDANVNAAAIAWPDTNPCISTPTPTATPTPVATATPTATPKPRPCSWCWWDDR